MFIRKKYYPKTGKTAIQIVENTRIGGKVSQKILRHVGVGNTELEIKKLIELGEFYKANLECEVQTTVFDSETLAKMAIEAREERAKNPDKDLTVNLNNIRETARINLGLQEVYANVYKEIGFDKLFSKRKSASGKKLFYTVLSRISNPASKRQTSENLLKDFGVSMSAKSIYDLMDELDEAKRGEIQKIAYKAVNTLFPAGIKVMFYDCTTLYFESFEQDDLKKYGFSKDGKFNQAQVVVALLVTDYGLPIGYKVYPGNKYEGSTVADAIDQISEEYKVSEVFFVADSGMLNKSNLDLLTKRGIKYIVGARLKGMKKEVKNEIEKISRENGATLDLEIEGNNRLIVDYKENRAYKDREDRRKGIEKLKTRLDQSTNPGSLISNFGYKNYIKVSDGTTIELDEEKIEQAEKWDGLHGIITNDKQITAKDALAQYANLWQIEECFRVSKTDLKIRPIYHWTPERIHAHIAICFMALVCVKIFMHRVATQYKPMSSARITKELSSIQATILKDITTNRRYVLPTPISTDARKLYKLVGKTISDMPYELI